MLNFQLDLGMKIALANRQICYELLTLEKIT